MNLLPTEQLVNLRKQKRMNTKEILDKIFKDPKTRYELTEFEMLGKSIHELIEIYPKTIDTGREAGKTKYFVKSFVTFSSGREEVQVFVEDGKSSPEEIVRQLWIYKLIHTYGYKEDEIELEKSVQFGTEVTTKAADIVVYTDNTKQTPKIIVEVKKPKEIPSDSLQNPSDPDATYSGHKGQGYQVQVMETYCKDGESDNSLNLITHVEVEPSHESDANALIPAIESAKQRNVSPEEVLADSLYGSDENCQKAAELGVQVIAPTMGFIKKEDHLSLSDFESSENGVVLACPQGHAPVKTKTNKAGTRHTATFDSQHCIVCPFQETCPAKAGKKNHYLRYKTKEMRLAKRRASEQTDEFKDRYRWRAGVEATMSEFDRKTGVKHLRVRGLKTVRFCATLKATAINLFRATAVQKAINRAKVSRGGGASARIHAILVFKEHFFLFRTRLKRVLSIFRRHYEHTPITAA